MNVVEEVTRCLTELHLPTMRAQHEAVARQATSETWAYADYLLELSRRECQQRQENRIERLRKASKLPLEKSWPALDLKRLPTKVVQQLRGLLSGDFLDRRENVLVFGPPGSGKSHLIQSIGQAACTLGFKVHYLTSGKLLEDLTAALADQTIHDRIRFYAKFDLLIIDEFGFDRIERSVCPQAASLWYKIIDARSQRVSTAMVTNIDFEAWADYLGDAPLAMALLDRVVDGATIVKLKGKSYRVHRGPDYPPAM
jgi:DNA replication protein DnaC